MLINADGEDNEVMFKPSEKMGAMLFRDQVPITSLLLPPVNRTFY